MLKLLPPNLFRRWTKLSAPRIACYTGLVLVGAVTIGCQKNPPLRVTHAPTYSYLHDPDARAAVELWPEPPTTADYSVISISERE